jgi:transcriptional regulator with XRE-family HTH domain
MSYANHSSRHIAPAHDPVPAPPVRSAGQPLHRLASVRKQQGYSLRRVARQLSLSIDEIKLLEDERTDLPLSLLYRFQQVLEVPAAELLVDSNAPLSTPVLERARMVKIMKTAAAILEQTGSPATRRLTQTLIDQLVELMPELEGVSPWHAVGQRRTLDELGRIAERRMPDQLFSDDQG